MPFTILKPTGIDLSQTFAFTGSVSGAGGGKLLQIQSVNFTSGVTSVTSDSFTATEVTDQITPSATNSKILVIFNVSLSQYEGSGPSRYGTEYRQGANHVRSSRRLDGGGPANATRSRMSANLVCARGLSGSCCVPSAAGQRRGVHRSSRPV